MPAMCFVDIVYGTEEGCARSTTQFSQHSFNLKHKTNIECKPSWELWEVKRAYIFFSLCDKEEQFWVSRETWRLK